MITCRELIDFIMDHDDGRLTPAERREVELHLARCPDCMAYLESYRETVKLGKAAFADPDEPVLPEVPEELVQAILAARRKKGGST